MPQIVSGTDTSRLRSSFDVDFFEVATTVPAVQRAFQQDPHLEDLKDAVEGRVLEKKGKATVRYVIGRRYDRVEIYEFEVGGMIAPFIVVVRDGLEYDTRTMGLGEYSAFYQYWMVTRLPRRSLLLLDEPEAFLPPRAQTALINVLAREVSATKSTAIIATHSPNVLANVDENGLVAILSSTAYPPTFVTGEATRTHLQQLGNVRGIRGLLLVEDRAARQLVRFALVTNRRSLMPYIDVLSCGSDEDVLGIVHRLPVEFSRLRVAPILDGDMRQKYAHHLPPPLFLPFDQPPDAVLQRKAEDHHEAVAASLGVEPHEFQMALHEVGGLDHHDWSLELARRFGLEDDELMVKPRSARLGRSRP